jgi:Tol biopolymer transport system component
VVNFLLDPVARDDDPTWSPDGTRLAFDSDREASGDFDLYIFDLLSGQLRHLTSGQGSDVAPAWQPQR